MVSAFRATLFCFICVALVTGVRGLPEHPGDPGSAADFNRAALNFAGKGDLEKAKPLFQRAVELNGENPGFRNNLGVATMRLGQHEEALGHFHAALEIDPGFKDAYRNQQDLVQYLEKIGRSEKAGGSGSGKPKFHVPREHWDTINAPSNFRHHVSPLPRIPWEALYLPENLVYATGQVPFLLVNVTQDPSWSPFADGTRGYHRWDLAFFASHFPQVMVDAYPHNMDTEKARPTMMTMADGIAELRQPSGRFARSLRRPESAYLQWNVPWSTWDQLISQFGPFPFPFRSEQFWGKRCLPDHDMRNEFSLATHWLMVLIGNEGAGMFNHWDVLETASFQFQVVGGKRWHICPPSETNRMYGAGTVDAFRPDYARFPDFRHARCFLDTIKPGEFLFYPRNYWHQTETVGNESISISATIVDRHNARHVARELRAECTREKRRLPRMSASTCAALENCFRWWIDGMEGSFARTQVQACNAMEAGPQRQEAGRWY